VTEFVPFPKIQRFSKVSVTLTEKIDGTNAAIGIGPDGEFWTQSRNRIVTPGKATDNAGFAGFAHHCKDELIELLGPGLHFGEWWGVGIQRGYDRTFRTFSLFNTHRWKNVSEEITSKGLSIGNVVDVVPVLYQGPLDTREIDHVLDDLFVGGSRAAPGYQNPEGAMAYLSGVGYLKLPFDPLPKSMPQQRAVPQAVAA
jgi:hypothetical protein